VVEAGGAWAGGWRPKLVALDIDGTLFVPDLENGFSADEVTPAVRAAVERLVDSGTHVVLASGRVPSVSRTRMLSRRAWNESVLDVEVSSRYLPWVGIQASQSNLRCADKPRSPAAVSITR